MNHLRTLVIILLAFCTQTSFLAQKKVTVGKGSYASYTPLSLCRSDEHAGDQSRYMQTRHLYITERPGLPNDFGR